MTHSILEFELSPAGQPLSESAAAGVRGRDRQIAEHLAETVGLTRTELTVARAVPLTRMLLVQTADAAPESVRPTVIVVEAVDLSPQSLRFRHRTPFSLRRLSIEIAPPAEGEPGCGLVLHGTVVDSLKTADGTYTATLRVTGIDQVTGIDRETGIHRETGIDGVA